MTDRPQPDPPTGDAIGGQHDAPPTATALVVLWTVVSAAVLISWAINSPGLDALYRPGVVHAPWWLLFLAGMATEALVVRIRLGSYAVGMSTNEVAVLAGLLLAPPNVGAPAVAAGIASALVLRPGDTVVKRVFNAATAVIGVAVAFLALPLLAPTDVAPATLAVGVAALVATLAGTVLGNAHLLLVIRATRGSLPPATVRAVGLTAITAIGITAVTVPAIQLITVLPAMAWVAAPAIATFLALLTISGRVGERLTDVDAQLAITRAIGTAASQAAVVERAQQGLADMLGGDLAILVLHDKASGWQALWRTDQTAGSRQLTQDDVDRIADEVDSGKYLLALLLCGIPEELTRSISQVVRAEVPLRGGRHGLAVIGRERSRVFRAHDDRLVASVATQVGSAIDRLDLIRTLSQHLTERVHRSSHDDLTDELNRKAFEEATAVRLLTRPIVTVLAVDLDGFGRVNSVLGHEAGDAILRLAAERLRELGDDDLVVARLGNDEFGVIVPDGRDGAAAAAEVADLFARPLQHGDVPIDVPVHVGYATAEARQGVQPRDLVRRATVALAASRGLGTHVTAWRPEMDADGEQLLDTATRLRRALDAGRLQAAYQPQVRLADGLVVGMEALARWSDPELGPIGPDVFIPIAEQTGLIDELTLQMLDQALRTWAGLDELIRPATVSINVSPRVLLDPDLPTSVAIALARFDVPASALVVEVTESIELHEDRRADEVLEGLTRLGVGIALDDYGTGYASMGALRRTHADELKVDQTFVAAMAADTSAAAIVEASVALAGTLRMRCVAEGIEHEAEVERLRELGCHLGQGYYWSRPLDHDELVAWLHERAIEQALREGDRRTLPADGA